MSGPKVVIVAVTGLVASIATYAIMSGDIVSASVSVGLLTFNLCVLISVSDNDE